MSEFVDRLRIRFLKNSISILVIRPSGWYGDIRFSRWAYYNKGRQTNWLCIK